MNPRTPDTRWIVLLALSAALAVGCTRAGSTQAPSLYVTATGALVSPVNQVTNGMTLPFVPGGGQIDFVLGNQGDAPLEILSVKIVSENRDMDLLPNLTGLTFPRTVVAGEILGSNRTPLKLAVHFTPGANPEDTPMTIQVTTNDESLVGGVFTFSVAPEEKVPELSANPPNYVFLNATATSSDSVDIILSNTGSEALALGDVYFETTSSAYSIIGGRPNRDTIIDPEGTGGGNDPVTLRLEYRPFEPPDLNKLVVEWGKIVETGVSCNKDETCQKNVDLCGDVTKTCPYSCGNGRCMCSTDADCKAYLCDDGLSCDAVCMTGVCRSPEKAYVELRGSVEAGQLMVEYGDQLAGCMDFTQVTEVGATCTKMVKLSNSKPGLVKLARPTSRVGEGLTNPYAVTWFSLGATQADDCGAVTGTEITGNQFSLTEQNGPITVAVTYTAPGAKAPNGELVIPFNSPYAGEKIIALCGGFKKGELEVAPPPRVSNVVMFGQEPTRKASKTIVIMNKGNEVLTLKGVSVAPVNPGIDPEGFKVLNAPTGAALEMDPGTLLPVTVEFDGTVFELDENSDSIVLNGFFYIDYTDPITGNDSRETVNLIGWVNVKNVTLPVADAGKTADYAGAKVNESVVLDGTKSVAGSFPIPDQSGYTWFISAKPLASKVFANPGPGPGKYSVIPDVPGDYEFRLVVFSYDPDSKLSFFSDEAVVKVTVAP